MTDARYTLGGEPFVMLTRELLASDTWRALGINARRFVDFLMLENMAHGGKENGRLKAPYEQLETFGVGARYLADAIREARGDAVQLRWLDSGGTDVFLYCC